MADNNHIPTPESRGASSSDLNNVEEAAQAAPGNPASEKLSLRSHKKIILLASGGATLTLVITWGLCSIFLSKTTIGNQTVRSNTKDADIKRLIETQSDAYKLTLAYPDGKKRHFTLKDQGLAIDSTKTLYQAAKRNRFINRVIWWQHTDVQTVVTRDITTFNAFIAANATVIAQPSQDAALSIKDGKISIADAVTGKQYGLANPQKTLTKVASTLKPQTLQLKTLAVNPALTATALQPYKASLEKTLSQPVTFTMGSKTITATSADIANWLEITPHPDTKKVDITVNSGKVQEYINKVTRNDIRPPRAQVMIKESDGNERILVPGVSGVDVINKSDAAASVANSLLKNNGISTQLTIRNEAFKTISSSMYDKWIEVDLTHKRMYAYEKDQLVNTQLVSAGAPSTPTVTGQYAIYSKFPQQDMRGRNVDGSNYFQPHVRWVSYFYKDYAIHGNYWRPLNYFGNINSSHGCVGVVDNDASWMYSWAPIGTPVIVHT